jgi:haloacetate dehalogenase
VFARVGGRGPALLLLHGFPQTHLMWHAVVDVVAQRHTVVAADLPGYGLSVVEADPSQIAAHSKRAMARMLVDAMARWGFDRFDVAGHDRGARVAYRMALDHPEAVRRVAVMDIVPTGDAFAAMTSRSALALWPFIFLAQPHPFPEQVIGANPAAFVHHCLMDWSQVQELRDAFPDEVVAQYVDSLSRPGVAHAICQEYRAAATVDCELDDADRAQHRRIRQPLLALWSRGGVVDTMYGGLAAWTRWAERPSGAAIDCGHFIPEEAPEETQRRLLEFFGAAPD